MNTRKARFPSAGSGSAAPKTPALPPASAPARAPLPAVPGLSRYGGLAAQLRARILGGEWAPGQAIESEAALARAYGVALGTLRQALALLEEDGLLERRQGRGTFVTAGLDGASMLRFFRFRPAGADGAPPHSRIVARRRQAADAQAAAALGLARGAPVLCLTRLRSVDQRPVLVERITLPLPLFEPLAASDTAGWGDLLYPLYQRLCQVVVHRAQDQLSLGRLTPREAKLLRLAPEHPALQVLRHAFDLGGRCVELRSTVGDAFAFEYTAQVR